MRYTMSMFASSADLKAAVAADLAKGEAALAVVRNLNLGKATREAALAIVRGVEARTGVTLMGNYNGGSATPATIH